MYLSCLWPALPELWFRGRLRALPTAIAFGLGLNFVLVARFIYPEWFSFSLVKVGTWLGIAAWLFCVIRNVRELPTLLHPRKANPMPDRFVDAHLAFLRGQWSVAETLLSDGLAIEQRDPPALLLLAGVYRHTGRLDAARQCIQTLRVTEAADRWWLEVDAEEKRLLRDAAYRDDSTRVSTLSMSQNSTDVGPHRNAIAA